jgi:hypothetical protein
MGVFIGLLGGGVNAPLSALMIAPILLSFFNAYYQQLPHNPGTVRGLFLGAVLGALVGAIGVFPGNYVLDLRSGGVFGVVLGFGLGALVGFISRVQREEGDSLPTGAFLFVGSILLGALLGAGVGLMAGLFLGSIAQGLWGGVLALLWGGIVGGYLGSYFLSVRLMVGGAMVGLSITAVSLWLNGPVGGFMLGSIAGSSAPMLLVAAIGAAGGLLGRGPKAMVIEALEAPRDMLQQGAASFLLPAVITGAVVGASAAGPGSLVVVTGALALLGMLFGVISDMNGRPGAAITIRSLVETAMMGADEWPLQRMLGVVRGGNRRAVWITAVGGGALGLLGAVLGLALTRGIIWLGE